MYFIHALKLRLERLHRHAAVIVTGAFKNTSFARLLGELGWDSLEDRRKLARLSLYKKMVISSQAHRGNRANEVLVPEYLYSMIPQTVGDRAGYVLRNASKLDTIKTRLVVSYNSFLPKTTRDWNYLLANNVNLERLQQTTTIESFKACYKREFLRSANPLSLFLTLWGQYFCSAFKKSISSIHQFFESRGFLGCPLGHSDGLFHQHVNSYACGPVLVSTTCTM